MPGAVMGALIDGAFTPNNPMAPVNRDMRLQAKGGDVDQLLVLARLLRLWDLHRPPGVDGLLPLPGLLLQADLRGLPAGLDVLLLAVGIPLAGRSDQRRIDDLARHRQVVDRHDCFVQSGKQRFESVGGDQRLAEVHERVGIRARNVGAEAAEPPKARPVGHQEFFLFHRQAVHRLQYQHPELQHQIEAGTAALRRIARAQCCRQLRPE